MSDKAGNADSKVTALWKLGPRHVMVGQGRGTVAQPGSLWGETVPKAGSGAAHRRQCMVVRKNDITLTRKDATHSAIIRCCLYAKCQPSKRLTPHSPASSIIKGRRQAEEASPS